MISNLNDIGKPVLIVLMVIGFIWFWPVGLAILCYLIWSGRLGMQSNIIKFPWARGFFTSGNEAFDEHRAEVLKQVEAEQTAFGEFAEKLRKAKDRSEFDAFMAEQNKGRAA